KANSFSFRTITNDVYPTIPGLTRKEISENNRWTIYSKLMPHIRVEVDSADVILVYFSNTGSRWFDALKKMFSNLRSDQKLLVVSDYPSVGKNPVRLNRTFIKDTTKAQEYIITQRKTDPAIIALIDKTPNVRYVDFSTFSRYNEFFKDAPFYRDTLMYYDQGHLNYYGSVRYAINTGEEFMTYLNWALKD